VTKQPEAGRALVEAAGLADAEDASAVRAKENDIATRARVRLAMTIEVQASCPRTNGHVLRVFERVADRRALLGDALAQLAPCDQSVRR
jgi:hypothetical protein